MRAADRTAAAQAPREAAMQGQVSELGALVLGLEASVEELRAAKAEVELDHRVLQHKVMFLLVGAEVIQA